MHVDLVHFLVQDLAPLNHRRDLEQPTEEVFNSFSVIDY